MLAALAGILEVSLPHLVREAYSAAATADLLRAHSCSYLLCLGRCDLERTHVVRRDALAHVRTSMAPALGMGPEISHARRHAVRKPDHRPCHVHRGRGCPAVEGDDAHASIRQRLGPRLQTNVDRSVPHRSGGAIVMFAGQGVGVRSLRHWPLVH